MNMEIFVNELCIKSVHSEAIYYTLFFIFSESVTTPDGYRWEYVNFAHFLLYFMVLYCNNFVLFDLFVKVLCHHFICFSLTVMCFVTTPPFCWLHLSYCHASFSLLYV